MSNRHSKLYDFFFCDYCRIIENIIVLFGVIFFIYVLYKAFSNKQSDFKILFKVMINVMICAILSILGYLINWQVEVEKNEERELLFGESDGFVCILQSIFLTYFQTARESLLTNLTVIVFLNYKGYNVEQTKFKLYVFLYSYGIPFISNIICLSCKGFGENDLFCFTNKKDFGRYFGIIHFSYLIFLLLVNLSLVLYIIINDHKHNKNYQDWLDDENSSKQIKFINSSLKKIIFYPFAQIFALIFPMIYRIGNNSKNINTSIRWAMIAAIGNSCSAVLYTLIFFISNKKTLVLEASSNSINNGEEKKSNNIDNIELLEN